MAFQHAGVSVTHKTPFMKIKSFEKWRISLELKSSPGHYLLSNMVTAL